MKNITLFATAALAALSLAQGARAQDAEPAYDQPVADQPVPESAPSDQSSYEGSGGSEPAPKHDKYDWEGRYVGAFIGRSAGKLQQTDPTGLASAKEDLEGMVFGGTIGRNYKVSAFTFGLESDFTLAQTTGTFTIPAASWGCNDSTDNCSTDINWYATSRARAGVAFDNILPYVTGGVALASVESKYSGSPLVKDSSGIAVGWTAGAGIEYGITQNFTVKGEALYVDLKNPMTMLSDSDFKVDTSFAIIRAGANFKF